MPTEDEDDNLEYSAEAIVVTEIRHRRLYNIVESKKVIGYRQAYIEARWLALKAQWKRLMDCGINYGIKEIKNQEIG